MSNNYAKMPNFWLAVSKLILGIICYSLYIYYIPPVCASLRRSCFVEAQIATVACVSFTFIIELAIIAAYLTNAEYYEKTILNQAFSFAGAIAYITAGSMIFVFYLQHIYAIPSSAATGSMFIITGALYLIHFIFTLIQRCKS